MSDILTTVIFRISKNIKRYVNVANKMWSYFDLFGLKVNLFREKKNNLLG